MKILVLLFTILCSTCLAFKGGMSKRVLTPLKTRPAHIVHLPESVTQMATHKSSIALQATSTPNADIQQTGGSIFRYSCLALWISFTYYAFNLAPPDADTATTLALIQQTVSAPFGGEVNPIYSTVFNLLGVYPAMYAALLLPGAGGKKQSIPAQPFVFGSFALGFFGLGPYLAFRNKNTSGLKSEAGFGNGLFESKLTAALLLIGASFLVYSGIATPLGSGADKWADFVQLFSSQRLVHVSTIDFTVLSLTVRLFILDVS